MDQQNSTGTISLSSRAFDDNAAIPAKFTCKGENINPALNISGIPDGAQSLALIMHDPDAVGGDWVHWLAWNIPASTNEISENSVPADAVEGMTSFGKPGWGGPCPPAGTGTHHYIFELYALDTKLNLGPSSGRDQLENAMQGHVLGQATLTGMFGG